MKRFTRILGFSLSVVLALSTLFTFAACPGPDPEVEKITVTFMNGTETLKTETINKGSAVSKPSNPAAIADKTFRHWYTTSPSVPYLFSKKLEADTTINAYYTTNDNEAKIDYYKGFNDQYNEFEGDPVLTVYVDKGTQIVDPVDYRPAESGYAFKLWRYSSGDTVTFPFNANSDLEIAAVMDVSFTVKFVLQGGTVAGGSIPEVSVPANGTISEPTQQLTREGYDFVGWVTSRQAAWDFATSTVTGNMTLYAKWKEKEPNVPEDKLLVVSSTVLDGVLHPFFASSAPDIGAYGQTQVSMISTTAEGNVDMGYHVPTVALDYSQITYVKYPGASDADKIADPTQEQVNALGANKNKSEHYWTEYKFLIKNNILFDDVDNQPLTIKDVIFNMYVYLDPSYTGGSTLYSTPIVGLNEYREQDENAGDGGGDTTNFVLQARNRRTDIADYFDKNNPSDRTNFRNNTVGVGTEREQQILKDARWIREEFYQELLADWNNAAGVELEQVPAGQTAYKNGYKAHEFTTTEEIFAYAYQLINIEFQNSTTIKTKDQSAFNDIMNTLKAVHANPTADQIKTAFINFVFDSKLGVLKTSEKNLAELGYVKIDLEHNVDNVLTGNMFTEAELNSRIKAVSSTGGASLNVLNNIRTIAFYYATGQKAMTEWAAEAQSEYLRELMAKGKIVDTIKGITVSKTTTFDGHMNASVKNPNRITLDEEHYVLNVKIAGVDPKAIWNFGFNVAPMYYYSSAAGKVDSVSNDAPSGGGKGLRDKMLDSDWRAFNYPGIDGYDDNKDANPGFLTHEIEYFNKVFKNDLIMRIPKGAGPFKASTSTHTAAPTNGNQFYDGSFVYFTANTNFKTTDGAADDSENDYITNVKFKNMRYQILSSTTVLNTLKQASSALHYAEVNAKEENLSDANRTDHLTALKIPNNGYGYVGINASFVPNINVRKAIMTTLDTTLVKDYYSSMAEIIYRPMSTNSWAYPKNAGDYYPYNSESAAKAKVLEYLQGQGYSAGAGGVLERRNPISGETERLEYTFTIAGSEKDHPAYNMFSRSATILNSLGFKITVYPDSQALIKLASGKLQVWAAAWGTTVDPDMFQVYHKDSKAQSVNNWGYPYLLDKDGGTPAEREIIDKLAVAIETGRSTLVQEDRIIAYHAALNYVMDLAIEYPTYQRFNLVVYNNNVIDFTTLNNNLTAYSGPVDRIWEVRLLSSTTQQ